MSVSYITEKTFAVCTYQITPEIREFVVNRQEHTVFACGRIMLTVEDKNINKEFSCKVPHNDLFSSLAFGAGIALGLLLLSNPMGWLILGCCAVGGGAILLSTINFFTHSCTSQLKLGNWVSYNEKVIINGNKAITEKSVLKCNMGGFLKPFYSETLAEEAAININSYNEYELKVNVGVSFLFGLGFPTLFHTEKMSVGIKAGTSILIKGNIKGLALIWTLTFMMRESLRSDSDFEGNETYQTMNKEESNNIIGEIKKPADLSNLKDVQDIKEIKGDYQNFSKYKELKGDLNELKGLNRQQLRHNNSTAQRVFDDINQGKYDDFKERYKYNRTNKVNINVENVKNASKYASNKMTINVVECTGKIMNGIFFWAPIVNTYFTEKTRKIFAEIAKKDRGNGINVITDN